MYEKLNLSVAELKRRLVRHDNYNTPPSQKKGPGWPDTKKDEKKNGSDKSTKTRKGQKDRGEATGSPKPRGGQKGHEGRTRRPKPTEFKEHTPNACPECGSDNLSITKTEERDITRKECTVKVITTRHTINTCRCLALRPKDIEPETGLPDKGSYDSSIIAEVADGYACRMPFRMIADWMSRHGIPLSLGTAHNIMRRLGESLGTPAAYIAAMIRRARYCTPTRRRFTSTAATSGCGYCTIR